MKMLKKLLPVTLFFIILIISSFLPVGLSKILVIIDSVLFISFLVGLNILAEQEIDSNKSESFWGFFLNIAVFNIILFVILYGLMGWIVL